MRTRARFTKISGAVIALLACTLPLAALEPEQGTSPLADKLYAEPGFYILNYGFALDELPADKAAALETDLEALGSPLVAYYDVRGDLWKSLVLSTPLVPGPGLGNSLSWADLGLAEPGSDAEYGQAVLDAFQSYLGAHAAELGVDAAELEAEPTIGVHDKRRLAHLVIRREVDGVPVRDSSLSVTVNSGNLLLYGTRNWGAIDVSTQPAITAAQAESAVASYLAPLTIAESGLATLELVPQAAGSDPAQVALGQGYSYRLVWSLPLRVDGTMGSQEALVDAHSGAVLAFSDRNQYLTRRTIGGIFPVSNDGLGVDGVEQPGHPMPFGTLTLSDGSTVVTNSSGLADFDGSIDFSFGLEGPFVAMNDACGVADESAIQCNDLDLGSGPGTDCDTPPGATSPGDTHASRTGFYELNRLMEGIRSRVSPADPANAFLNEFQVQSNMNINNACNAFFSIGVSTNVGSINFYREGNHPNAAVDLKCRNTGEIAAVFDHEYGHFLDFMDGNALSSPSEAYADIVGILRLNDSCIGRGFRKSFRDGSGENQVLCGGNGNPCLSCTGVREDDFLKHAAMLPRDIAWVRRENPDIPGGCGENPPEIPLPPAPGLQNPPCGGGGGQVHCNGEIVGEAVVDLYTRDLRCLGSGWENVPGDGTGPVGGGQCVGGAAPSLDLNTTLELATQIFYKAKGNIQAWYECSTTVGGCNADSGYHQFLAADDNNGSFADGTPHGAAITDAFGRHQLTCPATALTAGMNFGCPLTPGRVENLTATPTVLGAELDWDDVPGATEYWVFRTEGVRGCEFGKERVAVLPALPADLGSEYSATGLLDGFESYYSVMAVGVPGCIGQMSECAAVTPLSPGEEQLACPLFPIAKDDSAETFMGTPVTIDVLANDTDPESLPIHIASVQSPTDQGGTVEIVDVAGTPGDPTDDQVVYTPAAGFFSPPNDTFTYTIENSNGVQDIGAVSVRVDPVGDACEEPGVLVLTDPQGDASTENPEYDVLSLSLSQPTALGGDKYVFTLKMASMAAPPPNSTWPVVFQAADGATRFVRLTTDEVGNFAFEHGNGSNPGRPFATGSPAEPESSFDADGTIRIVVPAAVVGNPAPLDQVGLFLTRIRFELPGVGALTPDNMPGDLVPAGFYTVANCATEVAPVARDDSYSMAAGGSLAIPAPGVLANDTDDNLDPLTAEHVSGPASGLLALDPDGSFTYTPNMLFTGNDSFVYRACDDTGRCDEATVTIAVSGDNSPPEPADDGYATDEDTQLVVAAPGVLANDTDPDSDPLTAVLESGPAHGTLALDADGSFTYTPDANYHGADSFSYRAHDGQVPSNTAATVSITVRPINDPPTAGDDQATTEEDQPVTIQVLANDDDVDGDPLGINSATQPANGSVVVDNINGTITYTPSAGFTGTDGFTYTICDPSDACATANVTVTVTPRPDDDDDHDSDGERDDTDSDDDDDGIPDDADSDDDNDGDSDNSDSDDDNDGIKDDFDSESHHESQSSRSGDAEPNGSDDHSLAARPGALLLVALAESPLAESLTVEIYDPSGTLVATAQGVAGKALATTVPLAAGDYSVKVTNAAAVPVSYRLTLIERNLW